ncbi:hypothetical protein LINPERHAP1_LOCUS27529 [Linum perenne]
MPLFAFKSTNHFVASSDGIILQVYELTKPTNHLSSIQKVDWKNDGGDDDDIDQEVSDGKSYNGLSFLDGQGKIEGEKALTTLAQHLKQLHLLVSPKGYCFQQVSELGMYSDFGIHYLRLNDLFSWPRHNIDLATSNVWSRLEFKYSLPKHKNPSKQKPNVGGGKEEELEKLKEEMEEANEANEKELQKLKRAYEDQHKQVQKKDKELRMLKKMKDNTWELQRQLKKKDDELKILKKKMDEEDEEKAQRIEELEKVNKDLEEEMQKQLKRKDDELKMLKEKNDNGGIQSSRYDEVEKLKEELEMANKAKDYELQKLRKEKDREISKILQENDYKLFNMSK